MHSAQCLYVFTSVCLWVLVYASKMPQCEVGIPVAKSVY